MLASLVGVACLLPVTIAADSISVADATQQATPGDWVPEDGAITLGNVGITTEYTPSGTGESDGGHPVVDIKNIEVVAGSNSIITVNQENSDGSVDIGYGVLGTGDTVITVDGTREDGSVPMISDTSLKLQSFLNISELNIAGRAVVTLSPGMFMNGDMDHDLAGKEGLEKSDGVVVIKSINLGQGSLILHNGDGFLFDNGYFDSYKTDSDQVGDAVSNDVGYTLNVTHDEAYLQIGANMRSKWALINGLTKDGSRQDLSIGGYARETDITELKDIKNLTLSGGQFNIDTASGAIYGDLTITHGATVQLKDAAANIMADGSGTMNVSGSLSIGSTTQTFKDSNSLALNNATIECNGSSAENGKLVISAEGAGDDKVSLTYGGMQNRISADVEVVEGATLDVVSENLVGGVRDELKLTGSLSGYGRVDISGSGMVVLTTDNSSYEGSVMVNSGATLSLTHQHALLNAQQVTIDSGANLYFDNPDYPVEFQRLHMGDGSTLAIAGLTTSLTFDANNAALNAKELTFDNNGSLDIIFNADIEPMRVYNVLSSGNNIKEGAGQLTLHLFTQTPAGDYVQFDSNHYVTGYTQVDDNDNKWLFYVETRFGNIWQGDNGQSWNSESWRANGSSGPGLYDSSTYDYALFLNRSGVSALTVNLTEEVKTRGIYIDSVMDGDEQTNYEQTNYTFVGQADGVDIAGGTQIHLRDDAEGSGTLDKGGVATFVNVQAGSKGNTLGWVTVSVGTMALKNGTEFHYSADKMLQVGAEGDAALTVDASSKLVAESGATLTAATEGQDASVSGVKMTGNAILGGNTAGNNNISALSDAKLNGFYVEAIELRGTGSLTGGGIGADTGLSTDTNGQTSVAEGAVYTLGGNLNFSQTLVNKGTVNIAEGASFEFGNLSADGNTYTFISGGTINGWDALGDSDFSYNGVKISDIKTGATFSNAGDGQISLSLNGIKATQWDKTWNLGFAPAFGKTYTGGASNAVLFSAHYESDYAYNYGKIVEGGGDHTVVVVQGGGSTDGNYYLAGGSTRGEYNGTHNHWVYDEGSDYAYKIGGMMYTTDSDAIPGNSVPGENSVTGDSHLMITGAGDRTDVQVYGGSWGMRQIGNAYLSIEAGGYKNIYGGSRNVDLEGSVVMNLTGGRLNTYYAGEAFDAPGGWTYINGVEVGNGEFKYDSYEHAVWALGDNDNAETILTHYFLDSTASHWGGIYATGSDWASSSGNATRVLGNADIYLSKEFDFSTNFALIDGGGDNVTGTSTLHLTDGGRYENMNKDTVYAWIQAADERYRYLDQWSADECWGNQPFMGKFTSIAIRGFDRIELADGAHIKIQASRFNMDQDITISGAGVVELTRPEVYQLNSYGIPLTPFCEKDSEQVRSVAFSNRAIVLENGARLKVSTDSITAWNANSGWAALAEGKSDEVKLAMSKNWSAYYDPDCEGEDTSSGYTGNNRSNITINAGTTMDITDRLIDGGGGSTLVDIFMAGHGTDGLGALYKGVADTDIDTAFSFQFPYISLTDDASIGIAAGSSPIYMYGADNVYDNKLNSSTGLYEESDYLGDYNQSTLKLNKHTLSVTGGGTLALVNTTVADDAGGTINVQEGTLRAVNTFDHRLLDWQKYGLSSENDARHVTIAKTTDIVLTQRGQLHTDLNNGSDDLDTPLGGGLQALKFASLTGQGETNLEDFGLNGIELIVVRHQFYDEFMDENKTYWNSNGYGYAFYSGAILGHGDSSVSKSGDGVQYFSGSESTYGYTLAEGKLGGTYVSGGTLYLLGTSHFNMEVGAAAFSAGSSQTKVGVIGGGELYWTSYMGADGQLHEGKVYLSDGVRILNSGCYYDNVKSDSLPQDMVIGVEAAPNGTALNAKDAEGNYIFLVNQADDEAVDSTSQAADDQHSGTIVRDGVEYVRIDTHNLSSINGVSGIYLDGTAYTAGDTIDRNKMLLISAADWEKVKSGEIAVTVTGLGSAGYNEATYSGILANDKDDSGSMSNLVKEGAGTLVLDQVTRYTGTTTVEGGTLRFKGWVDPNSIVANGLTQYDGSSLMLSYDGSYTTGGIKSYDAATGEITMNAGEMNEKHELSQNLVLVGRGDVRWTAEAATDEFTDGETAALISDVAEGVCYTISGTLSGEGNFLHSGEGTTVMAMSNDYTLGSTVTRGTVEVQTGEGLGATAKGGHANLVTWSGSHVWFNTKAATEAEKEDGLVVTTLAAYCDGVDADGVPYEGNSVEGKITITSTYDLARMLHVTGNGYWAEETQLEGWNSTIVFCCEKATNTAGDAENEVLGKGAGFISGNGTIGVSDVDDNSVSLGKTMGDAFAELRDFTGSVVVEGEGAVLNMATTTSTTGEGHDYIVSSGVSATEGRVTVRGQGALFSAPDADITVAAGSTMNLTSSAYSTYDRKSDSVTETLAATVVADTVTISDGAELNVTHGEFDWSFNLENMKTQTSATMTDVLEGYQLDRGTQQALDDAVGYNYHYDKDIALNMTAAGATEVNSLTLMGGSTYRPFEANTSLNGGTLTLDVTETSKIALGISLDGELYQDDRRRQIVLFSGVDAINYLGIGEADNKELTIDGFNDVYYTMAENYFTGEYINPDVYLVWDSSAGVVYLDVIPEPGTATLSLLALAALAARRRRK